MLYLNNDRNLLSYNPNNLAIEGMLNGYEGYLIKLLTLNSRDGHIMLQCSVVVAVLPVLPIFLVGQRAITSPTLL